MCNNYNFFLLRQNRQRISFNFVEIAEYENIRNKMGGFGTLLCLLYERVKTRENVYLQINLYGGVL